MSHIVKITTEIRDIEAIKATCKELGFTFNENSQTYRWWGTLHPTHNMTLSALKEMTPEDRAQVGKCSHSISMPGWEFDLGLVKTETGFRMVSDDLLHNKQWHTLRGTDPLGAGCSKLLQLYTIHKGQIEAKKRGLLTHRVVVGKKIQLHISGM